MTITICDIDSGEGNELIITLTHEGDFESIICNTPHIFEWRWTQGDDWSVTQNVAQRFGYDEIELINDIDDCLRYHPKLQKYV